MEPRKSQKDGHCLPLLLQEVENSNCNNNNNSGNASRNSSSNDIGQGSTLSGSPGLRQENIFSNAEFTNQRTDGFVDFDHDGNLNSRRFRCEHCAISFSDPSNLHRHIRKHHTGARAHPCSECGKIFATSSGLKQHHHIHSSIKPFTCEVCRKSYTQFSNLCRHKRMHADCRVRMKCRNCGDFFPTTSAISKHRRFCDTKALFSDGAKCGSTEEKEKLNSNNKNDRYPPHLVQNGFSHLPGTSLLDFTFAKSVTTSRSRQHLPFLLPYHFSASGLQHFPREGDWIKENMSEVDMASAETQCNDQLIDCNQMTSENTSSNADSSRFERVNTSGRYLPRERRSDVRVQLSPMRSPASSPPRSVNDPCSKFHQNLDLFRGATLSEFNAKQLSPPITSGPQINSLPEITSSNNFKRMFDEMIARQRVFSLASAFAKNPSFYKPGPYSTGAISYSSYPYLPRYQNENEQPRDLFWDRLPNGLGLPRRTRSLNSEKSPLISPTQDLSSLGKIIEDAVSKTQPIGASPPWYSRHGPVEDALKLARFYGNTNESLPTGRVNGHTMLHPLPGLHSSGNSHPHMLSSSQMFSMLNSQQRMHEWIQRDYAGLIRRYDSQQENPGHRSAANFGDVSLPNGSNGQSGGRGNGRQEREKYVCTYCGKLFPRSANLTRHLRTHTGEQPYSCKYCERNFSISSNLQRHVRNIHKKERPYCCPLCKRAFGQQTNLARHLRKHLDKPERVRKTDLLQEFIDVNPLNSKTDSEIGQGEVRNSLSPKNYSECRERSVSSSDGNDEHFGRNSLQTSSDEATLPPSPNCQASVWRADDNDSLTVV